ncbi:probable cytochrome P450 49a1 [Procambarus clarkii]|uniref:probable cytochrome P450 49a1 n=1 Tax=Procambarus clarkii TaxID=6728 RepID=UPI001E6704E7|nr:probable cytochrome P450 49a1 [Procambarus clarkii]XP_045611066.1 probable cytochrome P450 49a1 [Procambarus clarkii]
MLGVVRLGLVRAVWRPAPPWSRALSVTVTSHQVTAAAEQTSAVKPLSAVPGPPSYPFVGTSPSMLLDKSFSKRKIHIYFQKMVEKYGPIVKLSQPFMPPMVLVSRPDDVETVIRATMDNPIRDGFTSFQKIREEAVNNYFENKTGILTENGEEWWRVRSRVQTNMMRVKEVVHYLPVMDQITLEFMDRISSLQSQFGEMPSDFQNELYKFALESVASVALNRRLGCLDPNIAEDSEPMKMIKLVNVLFHSLNDAEFSAHLWKVFPTPSFKRLKNSHQEFLEIADRNIRETETELLAKPAGEGQEVTLMEALLLKPGLTRKDVVTLILDMLFAGIDTTSHTLAFALYQLARNPEAQARLQEEVDAVLGDHRGPLTRQHLAQFFYLKAVLKESMRVLPTVMGTSRTLDKDLVLGGYLIPKGWSVMIMTMTMGWDESIFPRAKEFLPERWMRNKPLGPINPFATLQFGAGTRMCIGRRIAEQEMFTFLIRVMQRFTVDYKYEDIELESRLVFAPSQPLRFTFTPRN